MTEEPIPIYDACLPVGTEVYLSLPASLTRPDSMRPTWLRIRVEEYVGEAE